MHEFALLGLGESSLSNAGPTNIPDHPAEYWRSRVVAELLAPYHSSFSGGATPLHGVGVRVSKRLARAVVARALDGRTSSTKAFLRLGISKLWTLDRLTAKWVQR